jgi:hypothetical protein
MRTTSRGVALAFITLLAAACGAPASAPDSVVPLVDVAPIASLTVESSSSEWRPTAGSCVAWASLVIVANWAEYFETLQDMARSADFAGFVNVKAVQTGEPLGEEADSWIPTIWIDAEVVDQIAGEEAVPERFRLRMELREPSQDLRKLTENLEESGTVYVALRSLGGPNFRIINDLSIWCIDEAGQLRPPISPDSSDFWGSFVADFPGKMDTMKDFSILVDQSL